MYLQIEKIEGQWAVIEWGKETFRIPKSLLPNNAKPGDHMKFEIHLQTDSPRLRRATNVSYGGEEIF